MDNQSLFSKHNDWECGSMSKGGGLLAEQTLVCDDRVLALHWFSFSHYLVTGFKLVFREFVYSEPNVLICLLTGLSVDADSRPLWYRIIRERLLDGVICLFPFFCKTIRQFYIRFFFSLHQLLKLKEDKVIDTADRLLFLFAHPLFGASFFA